MQTPPEVIRPPSNSLSRLQNPPLWPIWKITYRLQKEVLEPKKGVWSRWAPIYIEVYQPLDPPGPTRRPPDAPSYVRFQPKLTYPIFDIGQSRGFWSLRRGSGQGGPQFLSNFINPLTHQDQPDNLRMCPVTSVFNQSWPIQSLI